jgi:hypothetical protein
LTWVRYSLALATGIALGLAISPIIEPPVAESKIDERIYWDAKHASYRLGFARGAYFWDVTRGRIDARVAAESLWKADSAFVVREVSQ